MTRVLAFDPSGNFHEGKGTSGICLLENGIPRRLLEIGAKNYDSDTAYWDAHIKAIDWGAPTHIVIEGYRLYNHKGMKASTQSNSDLETPQLIGAIKLYCYQQGIPLTVQYAHEVKSRWADKVLIAKGYLDEDKKFDRKQTNTHKRDSMRHGLHFSRYKL